MTNDAVPPPTGLKAKVNEVGTALYLKAPPKAQTAILNGVVKAQPVVGRVKPHVKKVLGVGVGILALRKLITRKR
ncbi:MAG: hypothetical protein JWM40_2888 [Frankiales bacterium]|nr:hypothetical protein [Frankiales bacterium]